MSPNESSGGLWGIGGVAAAIAVCCGFPLLVATGITVGTIGLAIGSIVVLVVGVLLVLWAWSRHRAANACEPSRPPAGRTGRGQP